MQTTAHPVSLAYSRAELLALFAFARQADVEQGGRYDARSGCIHIWTHRWDVPGARQESELMGSFSANWLSATVWSIDVEAGFSLADLLHELAQLEAQALGYRKHGKA
jgi:hypothetical protein